MHHRPLTHGEQLKLERLLRAQLAVLSEEAEQLEAGAAGPQAGAVEAQGDAAVVERERGMDLTLLADEAAVLREVAAALERLREGSYGRCEDCGRPIPRLRLAVIPYARRCVGCERQQE
ncbi:MAG TPA: TraR/DksA C4-type zinc finger protein [Planctomycetota bacterium]